MAAQRGDGCILVVWETKERNESNAMTVLSSIKNDGQEILADFLGNDLPPYLCAHVLYACADAALMQGKILMADDRLLVDPPFIPDTMELVHFNVLRVFAHLFSVLSGSQSMSAFEINPHKHLTVSALIYGFLPAIKSTDNKPTPMVTSKTAGYIHALIIDIVTLNNSESPYARAIRNEQMICQELDSIEPEAFCT
jgi:hypothetical protein